MINLLGLDKNELLGWLKENKLPAYRGDQVLQWVYRHGVDEFGG